MDKILKTQIGRTPLVRATKLEKDLGISKIYLKLEGNNPYGHREDRLAYLIIREALSHNKKTICIGTYGSVGYSLAQLTNHFDIKCVFVVPKQKKMTQPELFNPEHIEVIKHGRTYEDTVVESRRLAEENDKKVIASRKYMCHEYVKELIRYINKLINIDIISSSFLLILQYSSITSITLSVVILLFIKSL